MTRLSTASSAISRYGVVLSAVEGNGIKLKSVLGVLGLKKPSGQVSFVRRNRRILISVVIVTIVLLASVLAISTSEISKLTITLCNKSDRDLVVRVWVDEFEDEATLLGPHERVSFHWNVTGWPIHKYDILWHSPDVIVSYFQKWTYTLVVPFTERTITLEVG